MLGCIIQARMGSTRLPGKILSFLDSKNTSLSYTINQLRECKSLDKIVIATTINAEDDIVENFAKKIKLIYLEVILMMFFLVTIIVPNIIHFHRSYE